MTDTLEAPRVSDGRTLRRTRNREALLKAGLRLAQRGYWHADASEIAKEAGVSVRTFFMAFDGLEGYREELTADYAVTLWDMIRTVSGVQALPSARPDGLRALLRLIFLGRSDPQ